MGGPRRWVKTTAPQPLSASECLEEVIDSAGAELGDAEGLHVATVLAMSTLLRRLDLSRCQARAA